MTTRALLRSLVREILEDESTWPETRLNTWINDAIRDYSIYFPRRVEIDINCTTNVREYSLSSYTGIQGILLVEYPTGEDPPRFLQRRPETGTFVDLPVYDIRGAPPATLVIGEEPLTGETIGLVYSADHTTPTTDASALTFPDNHFMAIQLFCQWQAIRSLEMEEAKDPHTTQLTLSMLGLNSGRAERLYRTKIREYQEEANPGGYAGPWIMDGFDRVY